MQNLTDKKQTITDWPEEDRPREKLLLKGVNSLTDAELLAILIGSGNKKETAVALSQRILRSYDSDVDKLGQLKIKELIKNFNGIGHAKAISIVAALELGKRRKVAEAEKIDVITSSKDVKNIFQPLMEDLAHEEMWILFLNNSNRIIKKSKIHTGTDSHVLVDIKYILKETIENMATRIILIHNHPAGDPSPSKNDDEITAKLHKATQYMDIDLLDHIIVCKGRHYSYKEKGRVL